MDEMKEQDAAEVRNQTIVLKKQLEEKDR